MILKEGYDFKHFDHSDNLGETDDVLLLWDEAKTLGRIEIGIFLLFTRQSTLCYQKRKIRLLISFFKGKAVV